MFLFVFFFFFASFVLSCVDYYSYQCCDHILLLDMNKYIIIHPTEKYNYNEIYFFILLYFIIFLFSLLLYNSNSNDLIVL